MCFHLMAQFDTTLLALLWFSSVKAVDKYLVVFFFLVSNWSKMQRYGVILHVPAKTLQTTDWSKNHHCNGYLHDEEQLESSCLSSVSQTVMCFQPSAETTFVSLQ